MSEARQVAHQLVAGLADRDPDLLRLAGIELGPALEQQLFFALRDGRHPRPGPVTGLLTLVRLVAASVAALGNALRRKDGRPGSLVLIREPVHEEVVAAINQALAGLGSPPMRVLRSGRAAAVGGVGAAERLAAQLSLRFVAALWRHQAGPMRRVGTATRDWPAALRATAAEELPRVALGAAALASAVSRRRPSVLVAFDEVGTWARILPAVAARFGIPSLDLPHAEVADPVAATGAGYDTLAVYGSVSAGRLAQAGIDPRRIVVVGAPRFDALTGGPAAPPPVAPPRIVFAAQYAAGAMTPERLEACYLAALAAAEAVSPSALLVVPHPAEPAGTIAAIVNRHPAPPAVSVTVGAAGGLHAALGGARLLVTGWSNSVFEAALLGVPAIAVSGGAPVPVDFVAEGLALGASGPAEAFAAAAGLEQPERRDAVVRRAQAALPAHIGPLDGRAAERAARLVVGLAARPVADG